MKTGLFILIAGILCVLINDSLLYLQIKRYFKRKIYSYLFWFQSLFFVACIVGYHLFIPTLKGPEAYFWVEKAISVILLFYTPKTLYIIVNAFSLLLRKMKCIPAAKVISRLALGIALLAFIMILNGITWYRYSYKIERETVCIKRLPDNFNNFRIIQLTDLHLGSYGEHYPGITKLVNEVNRLKPDLIVFTGDMVNSFASEITPWIESLRELKAKYGKYAITGNHDYGTYVKWPTREDQENNLKHFFKNMELTGFKMLNNTNIPLVIGSDTLYLAGVENWGLPPFPCFGQLSQALEGTARHPVILLSHDPSHWRHEVLNYPVDLMLAGHTHAMQLGITIGNFRWSPAKYVYPEYNGLYESNGQQLYVSRGVGYLGFAGRIGQRPEITLIQLTNDCK
ncbi:metallophosphoesterase [Odoribacter sp. AF15-53]|uniref:metallophosphoesterase n=1 Tax=Odoribacter sp. AF15-53 TaxID=2292236 RepID=UPI000E4D6FB4|nr:metallophosphoesterase [Odoribacter sp. AF15-53]RHR83063.1 metallophosphoesterase [Odoribacter sp. AF15-53]